MNKQQFLINLMNNKYAQIVEIEQNFGIFGIEGDYRPRIDHYHDAIRALGDPTDDGLSKHSRLSAERLADDVEMLRQITARPLHVGRGEQHLSVGDTLTVGAQATENIRPNSATKRQLTDLYRDYTVFFIALMIDKAEDNIQVRNEENNILVQDCYRLEQVLIKLGAGAAGLNEVVAAANIMEHDGLRNKIMGMLASGSPAPDDIKTSVAALQNVRRQLNDDQKMLDAAGMRIASSQLMVYEGAKDVIKTLLQNGVNIAGKHTQSAVTQNQGSKERGF